MHRSTITFAILSQFFILCVYLLSLCCNCNRTRSVPMWLYQKETRNNSNSGLVVTTIQLTDVYFQFRYLKKAREIFVLLLHENSGLLLQTAGIPSLGQRCLGVKLNFFWILAGPFAWHDTYGFSSIGIFYSTEGHEWWTSRHSLNTSKVST